MGIVNVTPDSFSDGGAFDGPLGVVSAFAAPLIHTLRGVGYAIRPSE